MIAQYLPLIFKGLWVTLMVSFSALVLGLIIGMVLAVAESSSFKPMKWLVFAFTSIFRGLPELVILFGIYFGATTLLTHLMGHYINVDAFVAGILALGLIFASYVCQTFRAAFQSIPQGQVFAGKALNLTKAQIFWKIQWPQLLRFALPGIGNLWLVILKDSALVSLLGLSDIMNAVHEASASTEKPFDFYLIAAALYFVITVISQKCLAKGQLTLNKGF